MSIYGPQWPLSSGERDLFKMHESAMDQAKFELKNLILTSPGENLSDPNYGVGLRNYIFEMNTRSVAHEIRSSIQNQIRFYMPSINLVSVNVNRDSEMVDSYELGVSISFTGPRSTNIETLDINLSNSEQEIY